MSWTPKAVAVHPAVNRVRRTKPGAPSEIERRVEQSCSQDSAGFFPQPAEEKRRKEDGQPPRFEDGEGAHREERRGEKKCEPQSRDGCIVCDVYCGSPPCVLNPPSWHKELPRRTHWLQFSRFPIKRSSCTVIAALSDWDEVAVMDACLAFGARGNQNCRKSSRVSLKIGQDAFTSG